MPPAIGTRRQPRDHAGSARRSPAPRHARRVSGPIARPLPSVAAPAPRRGTTGVFERLRALPETRLGDRLLRGRACIWLIGIMLGGIVAMQVSLLKLNAGISQSVEQAGALERANAGLETEVARLASGERIQQAVAKGGMVSPPAGDVAFVRVRPGTDPRLAAGRMQSPSEEARQVMANGGKAAAPVVADPLVPADPAIVDPATGAPAVPVVPEEAAVTPAPVTPEPVAPEPVVPEPVVPEPVAPAQTTPAG